MSRNFNPLQMPRVPFRQAGFYDFRDKQVQQPKVRKTQETTELPVQATPIMEGERTPITASTPISLQAAAVPSAAAPARS